MLKQDIAEHVETRYHTYDTSNYELEAIPLRDHCLKEKRKKVIR